MGGGDGKAVEGGEQLVLPLSLGYAQDKTSLCAETNTSSMLLIQGSSISMYQFWVHPATFDPTMQITSTLAHVLKTEAFIMEPHLSSPLHPRRYLSTDAVAECFRTADYNCHPLIASM